MTGKTFSVLLADDVAALRKLVRLALEASSRFKVVAEAGTGLEAIDRARESRPDLVLLDLSMPELDGLEALPRVLEASPRSHVVILSGFNHVRLAPLAMRLGASAYLEKGLEPEDLVRQLLEILEKAEDPSKPTQPQAAAGKADPPRGAGPAGLPAFPLPRNAPPPSHTIGPAGPVKQATFRVLVVDSDPSHGNELANLLVATDRFVADLVPDLAEAVHQLRLGEADLVLVDAPSSRAAIEELLIPILTAAASIPVVALLPASPDADLAAGAMRLGTEDCLSRDHLDEDLLARSLLYAIERRHAQEARRAVRDQETSLQRLRELDHLKNQFFNAAAHELGTPLTPIKLQLARLRTMRNDADPAEKRSLEILERNVQRLLRLNQDILDVARLQAGHFSVESKPFDLVAVVREVAETFEPVARSRSITLSVACPDGLRLDGDASRLGQVLMNLVSNALKFTPAGGTVRLECSMVEDECRISVRDTGLGLRPDQIEGLFKPFSQVLGKDQPHGVGSGLGLFVSRGIVELHDGQITCESAGPGQGSTFTVRLPSRRPGHDATPSHALALEHELAAEAA